MGYQEILGHLLADNERVVSLIGPSGTGKTFSASFLQDYLNFRIARQLTTRDPRPDDKHYDYISREGFVDVRP